MGWSFPWVSSADSGFNFDFGVSFTDEQVREQMGPILEGEPPPVWRQMAAATGTDVADYVSEGPGFSAFALADGAVYHTYSTYARGLEFLMGYYPILDRAPKGRDEGDEAGFWIRRHDEYDLEGAASSSPANRDSTRTTQALPGGSRSYPVTAGSSRDEMTAPAGNSGSEPAYRSSPYRPVTPEVAGSSPVAPVSTLCRDFVAAAAPRARRRGRDCQRNVFHTP
jgi:hypothetical protein